MLPLEQLVGHEKNPRANPRKSPTPLEQCDTLTYSQELEDLPSPPSKLVELKPRNLSKSIPMPSLSCDPTIQESQFIQTSEVTDVLGAASISSRQDFLVQAPASPAQEQDLLTNIVGFGTKPYGWSKNARQLSLSLKTPQDYSIEEWEQSSKAYPSSGTWANGKLSAQPHLKPPTVEKGFLSLPTLNASSGTEKSRPAGVTKCEGWFKGNGLLADSQCLNPQMMALLLGFPMDWTRCLWELTEDRLGELGADICLVEPLSQPVQRSHLEESNILIPASSESEKLPLERGFKIGDRVRAFFYKGVIVSNFDLEWFHVAWDNQDNKLAAPYHVTDLKHELPLEQKVSEEDSRSLLLHDRLAELESKRDFIRASGPIAETGVWIEYGEVAKRKFRQAYYRSRTAIFPAKRQGSFALSESGLVKRHYIGEENSKEVKAAGEAIARRNELERISKEIKLIEEKL